MEGHRQVASGWYHLAVLKKDGTVLGIAGNYGEPAIAGVSEWKDIVTLVNGNSMTLGLKKDGPVAVAGEIQRFYRVVLPVE